MPIIEYAGSGGTIEICSGVMIATDTIVWITVNNDAGIALITGRNHDGIVYEIAPKATWSKSGKGWVITLAEAVDLHSLAWSRGIVCWERQATP